MEPRIFHGKLTPAAVAKALMGEFNRGNLKAQQFGNPDEIIVQVMTRDRPASGGQTALSITLKQVTDGVSVQIGKQAWLGVAASLGQSAFMAWRNPWELIGRLDDIAQDIENLKLSERVWAVIEGAAQSVGASYELSERLRRLECSYCSTANEIGAPNCIACGAPLGRSQPHTCPNCGFVVKTGETFCPNCKKRFYIPT
jgi:hypothetical protein